MTALANTGEKNISSKLDKGIPLDAMIISGFKVSEGVWLVLR